MPNHATRNDLPSNAKQVAIELLNARVADGVVSRGLDKALWFLEAHVQESA
jgi:hypothetical protein